MFQCNSYFLLGVLFNQGILKCQLLRNFLGLSVPKPKYYMNRHCKNSPNSFCYVCAKFLPKSQQRNVTRSLEEAYKRCFGFSMANLDKPWTPDHCCIACHHNILGFESGKHKLQFSVPAIWREPRDHISDCYFCIMTIGSYTKKSKGKIQYRHVSSLDPPTGDPISKQIPSQSAIEVHEEEPSVEPEENGIDFDYDPASDVNNGRNPGSFNQEEMDDLVRDLMLSKEAAELLASRLKEKDLLNPGVQITKYRSREADLHHFFTEEPSLCYCSDVDGLMKSMGITHDPEEWRLFIDSSSTSLKAVLLHVGNVYPSLPIAYSTSLKETHASIKLLCSKINSADLGGSKNGRNCHGDAARMDQILLLFVPLG